MIMQAVTSGTSRWGRHTVRMSDDEGWIDVPSCRGRLLLATPPLDDPNFDHTVVFILEHSPAGAIGVVINRVTDEECPHEIEQWAPLLAPPSVVFGGGPVEPGALIGVALATGATGDHWNRLPVGLPQTGDAPHGENEAVLGSVDLAEEPGSISRSFDAVRIFRGYAGWGAAQLDGELAEGSWIVVDATAADVFTTDPDHLWRTILARQSGRTSWLANVPLDLSAN